MASAAGGKVLPMRKALLLLTVLLAVAAPVVALAATGVALNTGLRTEMTDCASGGSASSTLKPNVTYLFRVTDSDTFLCFAATCAAGGEKFPVGTVMLLATTANGGSDVTISCRSSASTGDLIFTQAQ